MKFSIVLIIALLSLSSMLSGPALASEEQSRHLVVPLLSRLAFPLTPEYSEAEANYAIESMDDPTLGPRCKEMAEAMVAVMVMYDGMIDRGIQVSTTTEEALLSGLTPIIKACKAE